MFPRKERFHSGDRARCFWGKITEDLEVSLFTFIMGRAFVVIDTWASQKGRFVF
jgi:hypothetical protein